MQTVVTNEQFDLMVDELSTSLLALELQAYGEGEDTSDIPDQKQKAKMLIGLNAEKFEYRETLAESLDKVFNLDAEEKYEKALELQVALMEQDVDI